MTTLHLVPQRYLLRWRKKGGQALYMTLPGLAARILKEAQIPYREDRLAEELALWQAVWQNSGGVEFFAPIVDFPGFMEELKLLFGQLAAGEDILSALPQRGRWELERFYSAYREILREKGILDRPGQLAKAGALAKKHLFLPEVSKISLVGLGELSPLEENFISAFVQGRPRENILIGAKEPAIKLFKAKDPYEEVAEMAAAIRSRLEAGVSPGDIACAFPNHSQYLPILLAEFEKVNLPWLTPALSLADAPLGKALLALLAGELAGWEKHHLLLLTAPGWGFPFELTAAERRRLRWGPPLRGLPAWRGYLEELPGWRQVLDFISEAGADFTAQTGRQYALWLEALGQKLKPQAGPPEENSVEDWAWHMKAWLGFETVIEALKKYEWVLTPNQFAALLARLFAGYQIPKKRTFAEQIQVLSIEQLGAHSYEELYVGGLVAGSFPPQRHAHWLTKEKTKADEGKLTERLLGAAANLYLYYPETDRAGKLNLPTTLIAWEDAVSLKGEFYKPKPDLFLGEGILKDAELTENLKKRILKEGLSVSQLNVYANCPYQFYCSYVLQLKPLEEVSLDLDPRQEGIILHEVLKRFWQEHLEGPLPALAAAQAVIEGLLREEYEKAGEELPAGTLRTFREFIREDLFLTEQGFRPRYLERRLPNFSLETDAGPVQISGFIDRIDQSPGGEYVLYDYKTGGAPKPAEILNGRDVQIAAYLLAAKKLIPQGRNVGMAYYLTGEKKRVGIFHADFHRQLLIHRGKNCLAQEEFQEQLEFFEKKLQELLMQIFSGYFPIDPVNSRLCSYCPYRGICRKEVFGYGF